MTPVPMISQGAIEMMVPYIMTKYYWGFYVIAAILMTGMTNAQFRHEFPNYRHLTFSILHSFIFATFWPVVFPLCLILTRCGKYGWTLKNSVGKIIP